MKISPLVQSKSNYFYIKRSRSTYVCNSLSFYRPIYELDHISNINKLYISNISFGSNSKVIKDMTVQKESLKRLELLNSLTQRSRENVIGLVNHESLKDEKGKSLLSLETYLDACLRNQHLFSQLPNTIADNVLGVVYHKKLKDEEGNPILSIKGYLNCSLSSFIFMQF